MAEHELEKHEWHDGTLKEFRLEGRMVYLSIRTSSSDHTLALAVDGSVEIDCSDDWGPSLQILEFSMSGNAIVLTLQSGVSIKLQGVRITEHRLEKR